MSDPLPEWSALGFSSQSQYKKSMRREKLKEKYAREKEEKREAKRRKTDTVKMESSTGKAAADDLKSSEFSANREEVLSQRRERINTDRVDFESRALRGPVVVIDCDYDLQMTKREGISLSQQFNYSYGANRKSNWPCRLVLCGKEETWRHNIEHGHMDQWVGCTTEKRRISELPLETREKMVYLTADATDAIEVFDPNLIYVVGGIVDRNRFKNVALEKANSLGIRTAQFPLDQHLEHREGSKVLTVNHCVEIIVGVHSSTISGESPDRAWRTTLNRVFPERKKRHERSS
jgi:tRNA (guanine9-N1)-methyltransferase